MRTNVAKKKPPIYTHGGAIASHIPAEAQLRRSVACCMLWERSFYEGGESIAERIAALVPQCRPEFVAACAYEARTKMHLRHVPLLLVREMARHKEHSKLVGKLLPDIIQRADELSEFVALYWKDGKQPLSAQVKKGLAKAFTNFNEYQLAKYDKKNTSVSLRDVLFLSHAKPNDAEQESLWKRLINGLMKIPETWETMLSGGGKKKETFEYLMVEKKLSGLAFLRNLRNMREAGVDKGMVMAYAEEVNISRVLPFRFVAAARMVPEWEDVCDSMLLRSTRDRRKLPGVTVVIVDVSGSMTHGKVSKKSDMSRLDAAGALAAIFRESCDDCRLYATAGNDGTRVHATMAVPPRRGMALIEQFSKMEFRHQIGHGGIFLKQCVDWVGEQEGFVADRIIVLTDEQDCDTKANPKDTNAFGKFNYLLNVSIEQNGIAYNKWTHINGWSEACVDFIYANENIETGNESGSDNELEEDAEEEMA